MNHEPWWPFIGSLKKTPNGQSRAVYLIHTSTRLWFQRFSIFIPSYRNSGKKTIQVWLQLLLCPPGNYCNISPPKNVLLKMMFLFPRWDMLVSWRAIFLQMGWNHQLVQVSTCPDLPLWGRASRGGAFYTTICWWGGLEWNIKDGKRVQPYNHLTIQES